MTNMQIRSLDTNNPSELPDFFDSLNYSHAPHWSGCYCRYYHIDCSTDEWFKRDSETNRNETISAIKNGEMKGFLIYDQEKPVGWLNAQEIKSYKRLWLDLDKYLYKKYIVSICFVIHPDYRNQGLATLLLKHAITYYKQLGLDGMIALPPTEVYDIQKTYRGTLSMYLKNGYEIVEEKDGTSIVKLIFND